MFIYITYDSDGFITAYQNTKTNGFTIGRLVYSVAVNTDGNAHAGTNNVVHKFTPSSSNVDSSHSSKVVSYKVQ